jgi:hypothetical protein
VQPRLFIPKAELFRRSNHDGHSSYTYTKITEVTGTAVAPRHTSQSDYRTGDLKLGCEVVLTDLGRYLQVPFVSLAKCVGAMPSQQRLEEMRGNLIQSEILTDDGLEWKDFIRPARMSEEMTFKSLKGIISGILEQVPNCGVSYLSNPNQTPISERQNTSQPDGYLVRASNQTAPRTHWFDIAVPFEFKKERDIKAPRDVSCCYRSCRHRFIHSALERT